MLTFFVYELTRPLYAEKMGRPSLDQVIFFKCMLVGFFENVIYDTELEFRIADSLMFRKFLGYELDERTPDESRLRKTRQRMPADASDAVFGHVLDLCAGHGLLRGRALGTDSSLVEAKAALEERGLSPLISSPNQNRGATGFRREDMRYDSESDTLTCPAGQILTRLSKEDKMARHYKAKGSVCRSYPNFGICTRNRNGRAVSISVYEDVVRANRQRVHSEEARPLMQIRRQRGEAPFGYFKQFGGLRRFAGRGLAYAVKKTLIAALG